MRKKEAHASVDFSSIRVLIVIQDRMLYDRLAIVFNEYHMQYEGVTSFNLATKALEETHNYDLLIMEYRKSIVIPDSFRKLFLAHNTSRPKLLAFTHDQIAMEEELQLPCDLIIMLPLITSVLFNGLLQLFWDKRTLQTNCG